MAPASLYIAREFAPARSLVGDADALRDLNPWITELFPNAVPPEPLKLDLKKKTDLQRLLEAPLRGTIGDRIEHRARSVAAALLRAHYSGFGQDIPAEVAARFEAGVALGFPGYRYEQTITKAHAARRAQLLDSLKLP